MKLHYKIEVSNEVSFLLEKSLITQFMSEILKEVF